MTKAKATCSIDGCEKPAVKRTWCGMHYRRWHRHGNVDVVFRIMGDLPARIESYTDRMTSAPCWLWTGALFPKGYGLIQITPMTRSVHRVVWELNRGPIPTGMVVDHICHNEAAWRGECAGGNLCVHRRCINLEHLTLKTAVENNAAAPHWRRNPTVI